MDRNDAYALADLQLHWDEVYEIGLDGDIWSARFHGSADELRAHTCQELRELIRADYGYRQQARVARGADGGAVLDGPGARGPGLERADDDTFDDDFDGATYDDDNVDDNDFDDGAEDGRGDADQSADGSPHVSYSDIRGERMST